MVLIAAVLVSVVGACTAFVSTCLCSSGCNDGARNQAYEIAKSIQIYEIMTTRRPRRLDELVHPPRPHKPIMEALPRDPWGNAYGYIIPGLRNRDGFDVVSAGPDGVFFTDDDVGNWP